MILSHSLLHVKRLGDDGYAGMTKKNLGRTKRKVLKKVLALREIQNNFLNFIDMKATDLAKLISECYIHALFDSYPFIDVKYEDVNNNMMSVFGYANYSWKHVPEGMYLWLTLANDKYMEFISILKSVFGLKYIKYIFFDNGVDIILKIED